MLLVYFNHVVHVTLVSSVMVALFHLRLMKTVLPILAVLVGDVLPVVTVRPEHMNLGDVRLVLLLTPKDKLMNPIVHLVLLVHIAPLKTLPSLLVSAKLVAIVKVPMTSPMLERMTNAKNRVQEGNSVQVIALKKLHAKRVLISHRIEKKSVLFVHQGLNVQKKKWWHPSFVKKDTTVKQIQILSLELLVHWEHIHNKMASIKLNNARVVHLENIVMLWEVKHQDKTVELVIFVQEEVRFRILPLMKRTVVYVHKERTVLVGPWNQSNVQSELTFQMRGLMTRLTA